MISIAYDLLKKERDVLKAQVAELEKQVKNFVGSSKDLNEVHNLLRKKVQKLEDKISKLEADLEYYKRELTDRSNALEATKQDWLEACETITKLEADATDYDRVRDYERIKKLEADKALAVEALKYYGAAVNWQDYYYDSGDEPGDIQMAIDFEDVDYERDSTGDIIFSCGGKLARKALKKLEAE
jgi:chromosome segregation ATPase